MIGKPPGRFTLGDPDRAGYRDWCCSVDGRLSGTCRPIDAGPGTALAQPDPNELACVACGQRIRHVPEIAAPPQFVCAGSSHRPAVTTRPQDPRSPWRTRARARARISRNGYSEDDDEDRSESWLSHAQSTAGNADRIGRLECLSGRLVVLLVQCRPSATPIRGVSRLHRPDVDIWRRRR